MLSLDYQNKLLRPAWVEVDLDAVAHNVRAIKRHIGDVKLLAVVKANGYGLGAVMMAREVVANGADYLGVVMLDEAYELRRAGLAAPMINTGAILADQADAVIDLDIEQMIDQYDVAVALSQAAQKAGATARVHFKVDTGMSRFGVHYSRAVPEMQRLLTLPNIKVVGLFSHFPMSDGVDKSFALLQIERMKMIKRDLAAQGIRIPLWHMANSGGALDLPAAHFDMVRVGLLNYGYWPSFDVQQPFELAPAMSVRAKIVAIRDIERGDTVGYGRKFMATQKERIAVLPIGYADGYDRLLSKIGVILWHGQRAPIIGGLCMDAAFVKTTDLDAKIGDVVTLMGTDGEQNISPHDIAALIGSVSYEVMAQFGRRLPRVYLRDDAVIRIDNSLTAQSSS
ncbi:alanine racemase [candidate division KSB1 bacterium]|nr:alanine racemase [candidate division KSB1 bacterium]RQW06942.1 MAG: alanine racemase [candidate division KSB1 bacterium]